MIQDSHKIAFIICTNNKIRLSECITYLNLLVIPDGYTKDIITIEGADSMCSGYNAAMMDSNAKYKVYMHQDVLITDSDFILKLLSVFATDENIGMVGMVGAPRLDRNAIMWEMPRVGNLKYERLDHLDFGFHPNEIIDVDCIDGLLMATQYDVRWRDDIFTGFDFYDLSQSFEFHKNGYRVVVQDVDDDGIIHDDGIMNMFSWYGWRYVFVDEYQDMLSTTDYRITHGLVSGLESWKYLYVNRYKYLKAYEKIELLMEKAIHDSSLTFCKLFIRAVSAAADVYQWSDTVVNLYQIAQIVVLENEAGYIGMPFLKDVSSVSEALDKFQTCRQMIMRQELNNQNFLLQQADEYLHKETSPIACNRIRELVRLRQNK